MISKSELIAQLAAAPLFNVLEPDDLSAIAQRMRQVAFASGQLIFSRGDMGRELYLVVNGRVRLSILTPEGRELALAHASDGQIFGEIAALDGKARTADATAISATTLMSLPQHALVELRETHPRVATAIIGFLCERLRDTDDKLEAIALLPIEKRLARFLISALALQAPGRRGEAIPLDLGMSQSELALLIGASRPKVNAALMLLEDQGGVRRDGSRLLCNSSILAEIAGE